jgi:hypothetical protein
MPQNKKLTPLKAIRKFCVRCVQSPYAVKDCGGDKMLSQGDENNVCWFWPYRLGKGRPSVKVIRRSCLECQGGSHKFVRECHEEDCPVWPFRLGKNPARAGKGGNPAFNALKSTAELEFFVSESA